MNPSMFVRKIKMLFNSLYETYHQIVKIQNWKKNMVLMKRIIKAANSTYHINI